MDAQLTASGVSDIAHDAKAARLRPVTQGIIPACWKPMTSSTNQWIQVRLQCIEFGNSNWHTDFFFILHSVLRILSSDLKKKGYIVLLMSVGLSVGRSNGFH